MKCPRRIENPMQPDGEDQYRADHTCSYCGSLSAEEFLAKVHQGHLLIATDKNYKVYIQADGIRFKFYFQHFTPEQQRQFIDMINDKVTKFEGDNFFYVLPFFCRLTGEQL